MSSFEYGGPLSALLVILHSHTLRVWELNPQTRKIVANDCNLGQLKRIVRCIQVSPDDGYMFCGTSSGDVLQVWRHCSEVLLFI